MFSIFSSFALAGSAKLVHLSCSTEGVWGVDNNGMVYLRIGIKPPGRGDHGYLNPAWVPVDGTTQGAGAKFNKVFAGPIDWMVRCFLSTEFAMVFFVNFHDCRSPPSVLDCIFYDLVMF